MRSCLSARNRLTSTAIRLLSHRHRTRQRPDRYSRIHGNRRVILPILTNQVANIALMFNMESRDSMAHLKEKGGERESPESAEEEILGRAQGCLLGQLSGDSLGSLVEFQTAEAIRREYPGGVRELADGGQFDLIAGQPTDDSEMALVLARMLAERGRYSAERARRRGYIRWLESDPFDCGNTIFAGLMDEKIWDSQANGALMRISPLGIFGAHPRARAGGAVGRAGCDDHASQSGVPPGERALRFGHRSRGPHRLRTLRSVSGNHELGGSDGRRDRVDRGDR